MRFVKICFTMFLMALFVVSANAEPVSKKFTKEEIKKMSETKAVIETKFGNIELRFFSGGCANHANNFIDLAQKGFITEQLFTA